jgi:hypothetical protein
MLETAIDSDQNAQGDVIAGQVLAGSASSGQ